MDWALKGLVIQTCWIPMDEPELYAGQSSVCKLPMVRVLQPLPESICAYLRLQSSQVK